MTKHSLVKQHLKEKGTLTSWEAITLWGHTRLSATIHILRKHGWNINSEDTTVKDRFGNTTTYATYRLISLPDNENEDAGKPKPKPKPKPVYIQQELL